MFSIEFQPIQAYKDFFRNQRLVTIQLLLVLFKVGARYEYGQIQIAWKRQRKRKRKRHRHQQQYFCNMIFDLLANYLLRCVGLRDACYIRG